MSFGNVIIHYDGSNLGPIYLKDIDMRSGFGGSRGIYGIGQDQYVDYGSDCTLAATGAVMLSCSASGDRTGVIKMNVLNGAWTAEYKNDATGTI